MTINWNNVTSPDRNEIVFEGRNQDYGAYQIRRRYSLTLTFVIGGLIAAIAFGMGAKFLLSLKGNDEAPVDVKLDMTQIDLTPPTEKNEPPPPPPPPPPPVMETVKFVPPVIKDDANETEPPPPQEKLEETNVGTTTQEGTGGDDIVVPDGNGTGPAVVEEKAPEIFTIVEEAAEFPGGSGELYKYLGNNIQYPQVEKEAGIQGKVFIKFVVEADGRISNVEVLKGVTGGEGLSKEAVRVIKSMPTWKPAKNGGHSVRCYYNLPVVFKLN